MKQNKNEGIIVSLFDPNKKIIVNDVFKPDQAIEHNTKKSMIFLYNISD